jgi:DNA-binding winged helix-turn-helix (wHTH) protein/predicted ATPase
MQAPNVITFGCFRLDLTNECLWHGTRAIALRPKAFAVLRLLMEHPGLLVTKQQVLDTVWPGTFVGDAVLKDNIRQLRDALNDDARSPTYIETAHRRGYRFIGKLFVPGPIQDATIMASHPRPTLKPDASGAVAVSARVLGRDAQFIKLHSWLAHALAGERQTVFITGEVGIGKTTLVQGFLDQVRRSPGILVLRGQCLEHHGSGEAYFPVLTGVSRLCQSPGGARVLHLLRKEAPTWLAQMPAQLIASEGEPPLYQPAGGTRERMLREMADAINVLTSESPLLLVLEDLHWSDYSTLDLISYLARRAEPARLMVVGTYRPVDVILGDHPLKAVKRELQAHGLCHELPLECLTEEAVEQYLAARFPGCERAGRFPRTIYQRTEGNPLFMTTLIEHLVEQKVLIRKHARWKLEVGLAEVEKDIPATLRELIESQIERLSPGVRRVLEGASVAGMECSAVAIAASLDVPAEWVETQCEELARRHRFLSPPWIAELPDGTLTPRYRFNHILYLQVPYSLIPPKARAQMHEGIAARGVTAFGDRAGEIAAELAMHFEQSRNWPSALKYLLIAAENAAACFAHHEASDFARRGLAVLQSLPETPERAQQEIRLRVIRGFSLMPIKGFASEEVEEVFAGGRELFRQQGRSPELFQLLWSSWLYYQFKGDARSAIDVSRQLLELAEDLQDAALIMEAHRAMGGALVIGGQCVEGLQHIEKALALYSTYRDHRYSALIGRDCKVMCGCFGALALWALGDTKKSLQTIAESLEFARGLGQPQALVAAAQFAAQLHHLCGEPSLSYERAKECADLAAEYGLDLWHAFGASALGWAEAELGDAQQGVLKIQDALEAYASTGAKLWSSYFLRLLADQLAKAGRLEEALATITQALKYSEASGEGYALAELHRLKGELILKIGDRPGAKKDLEVRRKEAQACFAEGLAIAKQQQAKSWESRIRTSMKRAAGS